MAAMLSHFGLWTAIRNGTGMTGLAAGGRWTDKLVLFGQFVGAWDVDLTWHRRHGSQEKQEGEWHFDWARRRRGKETCT